MGLYVENDPVGIFRLLSKADAQKILAALPGDEKAGIAPERMQQLQQSITTGYEKLEISPKELVSAQSQQLAEIVNNQE